MKKDMGKFLVVKNEWIQDSLSFLERHMLTKLIEKVVEGKPEHSYYVVNTDEPYAEKVWELIEKGENSKLPERRHIKVQYPVLDHTESVAFIGISVTPVNKSFGNRITIDDAFCNKANSLFINVNNAGENISSLIIKAGGAYPNSMLGDIEVELPVGVSAFQLQDLSRFQKSDDSIDLDFGEDFTGTIYTVAKWAGVRPVSV